MIANSKSIRTFIGAKDYKVSRQFYRELGFEEKELSHNMCVFYVNKTLSFYLQDYYAKEWVNNSMVFLEVEDVDASYEELRTLCLPEKYKFVKLSPIKTRDWGREIFMHDPSGVLWHFGAFRE